VVQPGCVAHATAAKQNHAALFCGWTLLPSLLASVVAVPDSSLSSFAPVLTTSLTRTQTHLQHQHYYDDKTQPQPLTGTQKRTASFLIITSSHDEQQQHQQPQSHWTGDATTQALLPPSHHNDSQQQQQQQQ